MGKKARRLRATSSTDSVKTDSTAKIEGNAEKRADLQTPSEPKPAEKASQFQYPKFVREHKTAVSLVLSLFLVFLIAYGAYSVRAITSTQEHLLGADDPYFWSRLSTYIVNNQIPELDSVRLHPDSEPFSGTNLFPYIGAWFYYAVNAINGMDLYRSFFYFSPFFAALSVIPAFWIGRELHSNKAGIFAAFFVAFTPSFLFRSMGGYYDTDAVIMLCSTLVVALFLSAYNRIDTKNWKKPAPIILAALTGILLIVFSLVWSGWAYIPWLFAGFFIVHEGYQFLVIEGSSFKEKFRNTLPFLKSHLLIYVVMIASAFIFWWGFHATYEIAEGSNPLNEVIGVTSFFQTAKAEGGIFPNVWISISEEMSASSDEVISRLSPIIFGFGVLGLILLTALFVKNFRNRSSIYPAAFIFLAIWTAPTLYGSFWAVRFIQMLAIPMAICAGLAIAILYDYMLKLDRFSDKKDLMKKVSIGLAVIFTALLAYFLVLADTSPYKTSASMGASFGSGVTQGWEDSMAWLKNNSAPGSVVATYWDPGYLINSLSERNTIYDGGTQNNWRITPVEELNGLDCMKDRQGYIIDEASFQKMCSQSPYISVYCRNKVSPTSYCVTSRMQDMAGSLYTSNESKAALIIESYRGDAPEMYFLASNDLIGKSQWWTYFSNWDPEKGQGTAYPYSVSALSGQQNLILENGTALIYGPFYIKITTKDGTENIEPLLLQGGRYYPIKTMVFYNNGTLQKVEYENAQVPGTLWVDPSFRAVIYMAPQVEQSMFTRMFFYDGEGFKYFKEVYANQEIKIFRLDLAALQKDYPAVK